MSRSQIVAAVTAAPIMSSVAPIIFFAYCLWLFSGLGYYLSHFFAPDTKLQRCGAVLVAGIATATIISTIGYFAGLSTWWLFIGLSTGAAIPWICIVLTQRIKYRILNTRGFAAAASASLLFCTLLLLPTLLGGLQFSFFQGNHHDTYNYLECSLSYFHLPCKVVKQDDLLAINSAGGFNFAHLGIKLRPSITVLYGTLCHFFPEHAVGNHYGFLTVFIAVGVIVLAGLIQALAPCLAAWKAIVYSSAVLIGFWGQYILDINAWSQIAWLSLIIYCVCFPLLRVRRSAEPTSPDILARWWIPWLVALVATVYIYPEGAVFSLVPLLTLTILCMAQKPLVPLTPSIGALAVVSAVLLVPVYESNLLFLHQQTTFVATSSVNWWVFFQAFLGGRDGFINGPVATLADGIASCLGVWYATPSASTPPWLAMLWRGLHLTIGGALLLCFLSAMRNSEQGKQLRWRAIALFLLVSLAQTVLLLLMGKYWAAGKALSYYAPIGLATILAALSVRPKSIILARIAAVLLAGLLLSGAGIAVGRIYGATKPSGVHYAFPYPAIQDERLKTTFNYGDLTFLSQIYPEDYVAMDIDNAWTEEFVRMELIAHRIPFYSERPVRADRYAEKALGYMPKVRQPTLKITVEVDQLQTLPSFLRITRFSSKD